MATDGGISPNSFPNKRLITPINDYISLSRSPISLISKGISKFEGEMLERIVDVKDEEFSGDSCGISPSSSPNKRMKTLINDSISRSRSPISLISKGISKFEGEMLESIVDVKDEGLSGDSCGICFSEAGNGGVSRGCIDCCDHYFCFLCIMEWSRVESKCPLCKRRFSTICRPAKLPVFASERVVQISVRDQVYYHYGNASIGPVDPYCDIKCSVCFGQTDECLLLLCDLCDSAAHTYCIGFGVTVPEGDWFCKECTLSRDERLKTETGPATEYPFRLSTVQIRPSEEEQISIFDVIQDSPVREAYGSRRMLTDPSNFQLPSSANDGTIKATQNRRTLQHCRNLNDRICLIRDNWNAFQRGILHFSANAGDDESFVLTSKAHGAPRKSVSGIKQPLDQCSSSGLKKEREIQKAWKMMDKAKALTKGHPGSGIKHKEVIREELFISKKRRVSENVASIGSGGHYHHSFSFSTGREMEVSTHTHGDNVGSTLAHSRVHVEPKPFTVFQSPPNAYARSMKNTRDSSLEVPSCSTSYFAPESTPLDTDNVNGVHKTSLSCTSIDHTDRQKRIDCSQQYDEAKNETRSLVKHYLKLRAKKEKLDVDAFKEVARRATHSVLAACGLEAEKPGSCSIPAFVCPHVNNNTCRIQKSNSMSNSCIHCFHSFVKETVDAALVHKTGR